MNEKFDVSRGMRFSQPISDRQTLDKAGQSDRSKNGKRATKSLFVFGLIIIAVIAVAFLYRDKIFKDGVLVDEPFAYSAVFLSNGQVYFGHIVKNGELEMVLEDVYYLKSPAQGAEQGQTAQQASLELVKLGGEIHGPTNELRVNRTQILFYEKLRDDSQVVEAIKSQS